MSQACVSNSFLTQRFLTNSRSLNIAKPYTSRPALNVSTFNKLSLLYHTLTRDQALLVEGHVRDVGRKSASRRLTNLVPSEQAMNPFRQHALDHDGKHPVASAYCRNLILRSMEWILPPAPAHTALQLPSVVLVVLDHTLPQLQALLVAVEEAAPTKALLHLQVLVVVLGDEVPPIHQLQELAAAVAVVVVEDVAHIHTLQLHALVVVEALAAIRTSLLHLQELNVAAAEGTVPLVLHHLPRSPRPMCRCDQAGFPRHVAHICAAIGLLPEPCSNMYIYICCRQPRPCQPWATPPQPPNGCPCQLWADCCMYIFIEHFQVDCSIVWRNHKGICCCK